MKRIQEKVKDIVEVRPYPNLRDFTSDPALTIAGYHFTDSTADLMAKWLDRIANVPSHGGGAFALAGYRGVGKTHFLAALGAIAANPEMRMKVTDQHVSASVNRLQRRHYPVASVRRGTHETFIEEFREAVVAVFEVENIGVLNTCTDILTAIGSRTGDLPFILLVDTALERNYRVSRDDGPVLAEIAEAVKDLNIFLGVALDDDIAGADGSNSAIARTFTIDYLDQEHLYKVVNSFIFPKYGQMQDVLHDIYESFREVVPNFRWSEQKFSALYPLHPEILEIAPFVRLYVHDFALLGFASEAGERILGRPANSLIALDEVFDSAEQGLRAVADLDGAFKAFDRLNDEVVAKIPVMQRLQAKLILKALILLSLDGQGTTAGEISAAMLIFDENEPQKAVKRVEDFVSAFAAAMPDDIEAHSEDGRDTRYGFKITGKDSLNDALNQAAASVSDDIVPLILRRLLHERFSDNTFSTEQNQSAKVSIDCPVVWRGGVRRGRLHWIIGDDAGSDERNSAAADLIDWEVYIDTARSGGHIAIDLIDVARVFWKPDNLKKDEIQLIRRFHALTTKSGLRERFSEQIGASAHSHAISVDKILNRAFFQDGKLVIDGFDYNFTDEALLASTFPDLFSVMLEPLFETRYPAHPNFGRRLGMAEVASLATDLYSGSRQNLPEVQQLAQDFAFPIGLVRLEGAFFQPETDEKLATLPFASDILAMVKSAGSDVVELKTIYAHFRNPPIGLVREAQHLILTALVAQRLIEFVTSKGDRINRRSLDLKLIWDDIVGVARPIGAGYSNKRLARWAAAFTKKKDFALESDMDREALRTAFADWFSEWRESRTLERFSELPDEVLNMRIWRLVANSSKSLGSIAESIRSASESSITLEECLTRIADTFSDSEAEMQRCIDELTVIDSFVKGTPLRERITTYLALCEVTEDPTIEDLREKLVRIVDKSFVSPSEANNREIGYLWEKFQRTFGEYFAERHDIVMKSPFVQGKYEEILRSENWWQFENLSRLQILPKKPWNEARKLSRELSRLDCSIAVREELKNNPFCKCSFSLSRAEVLDRLPVTLTETVGSGIDSYRQEFHEQKAELIPLFEGLRKKTADKNLNVAASAFAAALKNGADLPRFTSRDFRMLDAVFNDRASIDEPLIEKSEEQEDIQN